MRPTILVNCDVEMDPVRNLLRLSLLAAYVDVVAEAGGRPVIVSPTLPAGLLREQVACCDGALFVGSAQDYPPVWYGEAPHPRTQAMSLLRADADRELIHAALARGIPILGICGGHQLINLAFGGRLIQHLPQAVAHTGGKSHPIDIRNGRILRELFGDGRLDVNSWHHQAVPLDGLGQGLVATAFADDGIVEALEGTDPSRFLLGVQWHPERSPDPEHCRQLLGALIQAAAARVRG